MSNQSGFGQSKRTYEVVNPATEQVIGEVPDQTPADAATSVERSIAAWPEWAAMSAATRAKFLLRANEIFVERTPELIDLVQAETGGTTPYVTNLQVTEAGARLRRFAEMGLELEEETLRAVGEGPAALRAEVVRQPLGPVACITPYNVPLAGITGKLAPALMMGNTVVIKPAVQTPLSALALKAIFDAAEFPSGVVEVVTSTDPATSRGIVANDAVAMISFTGSTAVGADIASVAAPRFARTLLELGGKGAAVLLDDVDIDQAITGVSSIFTRYSGQICTAPSRLFVPEDIFQQVVDRVSERADALTIGDPAEANTDLGPVISAAHRDRVQGMIGRAISAGARLAAGADRTLPDTGYFVAPTVIVNADPHSEIMQEEVFGPVLVIAPYRTEDEAVALVNNTRYGLTNYVWTGDSHAGRRFARRLRAGTVGVNTSSRHPDAPFGGVGASGIGREGGVHSLLAYSEPQSIVWGEPSA